MSVTNAISSVIIVGAILALSASDGVVFSSSSIYGFLAIILAAVNIFGGFLVTQRMLAMYKKKKRINNKCLQIYHNFIFSVWGIIYPCIRGLSSPETSRQGNLFGIIGMVIAVTVTFLSVGNFSSGFIYVIIFLAIGGSIGAFIAYRIPMTAMPELVAGYSLVGLAAVFVAISAL